MISRVLFGALSKRFVRMYSTLTAKSKEKIRTTISITAKKWWSMAKALRLAFTLALTNVYSIVN